MIWYRNLNWSETKWNDWREWRQARNQSLLGSINDNKMHKPRGRLSFNTNQSSMKSISRSIAVTKMTCLQIQCDQEHLKSKTKSWARVNWKDYNKKERSTLRMRLMWSRIWVIGSAANSTLSFGITVEWWLINILYLHLFYMPNKNTGEQPQPHPDKIPGLMHMSTEELKQLQAQL